MVLEAPVRALGGAFRWQLDIEVATLHPISVLDYLTLQVWAW